jgi:hypothetical protein
MSDACGKGERAVLFYLNRRRVAVEADGALEVSFLVLTGLDR